MIVQRRNVLLLALCQALFMTGSSMVITVTALAGASLAPAPAFATLPISLQFLTTMATTIPASFVMRRFGRRAGFMAGAVVGAIGGVVNVTALLVASFPLFCLGSAVIGVLPGFAIYYRFAAADCADDAHRARAISWVLAGGVIAAFTGPNLATATVHLIGPAEFAGAFAALAALQAITLLLLAFVDIPRLTQAERSDHGRPLKAILDKADVPVAVLAAVAGYSAMTLVMTATPLAMTARNHAFSDAAFVIQWHVFAMFAPSFFTGSVIRRIGVLPVIAAGALLILTCVAVNLSGSGLGHFIVALMALGVGWNFMFIGGTSLLTASVTRSEQAKVQGLNDFLVFASVALASLGSGALEGAFGWHAVNLGAIPGVTCAFLASLWLWQRRGAQPA